MMRLRSFNGLTFVYILVAIFLFVQFHLRQIYSDDNKIIKSKSIITDDHDQFEIYSGKSTLELNLETPTPVVPKAEIAETTTPVAAECGCKSPKSGKTFDFCYRLPEQADRKGRRMSCEWVEEWERIEDDPKLKYIDLRTENVPEPVFVTAFNEPFSRNGLRLISSIRKLGYHNKIVIYDLGLESGTLDTLENKTCNVEVRRFRFESYPSYMRHLREYRWKPLVIAEALRDFGAVWYFDSSIILHKANVSHVHRLLTCQRTVSKRPPILSDTLRDTREKRQRHEDGWDEQVWENNLDECRKSSYMLHGYSSHGIWSVTHPGVYTYIPTNLTLIKKEKAKMYDAGLVYAVSTRDTMLEFVKWYVLCALEEECMAPKGAQLMCHFAENDRFRQHARCHRYDQSIINLLLANRFLYDRHFYVSEITDFFRIDRSGAGAHSFELGCI